MQFGDRDGDRPDPSSGICAKRAGKVGVVVGPRPIVEAEIQRYGASFAAYCSCRPGITGLWQVHGRSDVDYARRVELDRLYADEWSLLLDLTILMKTAIVITRRHGAY